MKQLKQNLVDFCCLSGGDSGAGRALLRKRTMPESYKLLYVYEGVCRAEINGTTYDVPQGSSALVFPFTHFAIRSADAEYVWLEFTGVAAAKVFSRIAFSPKRPVLGPLGVDGFERFFMIPQDKTKTYLLYRRGGSILLLLSYYIEKFPADAAEPEGYVGKACQYIDNNYTTRGFCVKNVTETLKIDRSYLYRLFKSEVGVSISEYITRLRILKAEELLFDSALSVKDVAYSVGFTDQMYFSRVFKRFNGRTPTQFRQQVISGNDMMKVP